MLRYGNARNLVLGLEVVLQVVAGIVLLERAQAVPNVAVGQHHF